MFDFNASANPVIENGKLILVSQGGSRMHLGIRTARKQLSALESKATLRESSVERRELLRRAVALWDAR